MGLGVLDVEGQYAIHPDRQVVGGLSVRLQEFHKYINSRLHIGLHLELELGLAFLGAHPLALDDLSAGLECHERVSAVGGGDIDGSHIADIVFFLVSLQFHNGAALAEHRAAAKRIGPIHIENVRCAAAALHIGDVHHKASPLRVVYSELVQALAIVGGDGVGVDNRGIVLRYVVVGIVPPLPFELIQLDGEVATTRHGVAVGVGDCKLHYLILVNFKAMALGVGHLDADIDGVGEHLD